VPMVTPASLGGNGRAQADAVAKPVMSHSAGMSVLTIASYIGVLVRTLMMWTLGNAALSA